MKAYAGLKIFEVKSVFEGKLEVVSSIVRRFGFHNSFFSIICLFVWKKSDEMLLIG